MEALFDSKLMKIINEDYQCQKVIGSADHNKYILYFKGRAYIIRNSMMEIRNFVKAHYEKRKECNFREPKYELKFFNPIK